MQPSAGHTRKQSLAFVNHTPRHFETITLVPPTPEDTEAGKMSPSCRAFGAGPLYTKAIMGQSPSAEEREQQREAYSTILREDSIHVEESENPDTYSRPDPFSIHHDCTDQAPYAMITEQSLLHLPFKNPSHDLAFFLRTTGPTTPHHRPSKVSQPARPPVPSKNAFKFLKRRRKLPQTDPEIQDAGGLLAPVEQKVSAGGSLLAHATHTSRTPVTERQPGSTYFALKVPKMDESIEARIQPDGAPMLSPSIVESRVSISFADSINSMEGWKYPRPDERPARRPPTPAKQRAWWPREEPTAIPPVEDVTASKRAVQWWPREEATIGATDEHVGPIRPAASNPPTPEPVSAVSMAESYQSDLHDHPANRPFDASRALSGPPAGSRTSTSLPLPEFSLRYEEFPVQHPGREKDVEIEHPCPRRFASHQVLLQRASSLGASLYRRSFTDSPGPPPPKSPLRPRKDAETIEGILASYGERGATPKLAPSIRDVQDFNGDLRPFKPTVVTDCTGPIKRPKSRGKNPVMKSSYQYLRREREDRTRARKLRDRPMPEAAVTAIDTIVNAVPDGPRQKLRKARPHIQIPGSLRPTPLVTRTSSTASSNASWKKVTESTQAQVPDARPDVSPVSNSGPTGYTPVSPVTSSNSATAGTPMALSPVMLVAEEIPVQKAKPTKPAKILVKDGKSYNPRPRSASIPRSAMKRRSRQGAQNSSRAHSPAPKLLKEDTPPLPSPPPNRALPPTPPASGSEKPGRTRAARIAETKKELPGLPIHNLNVASKTAMAERRLDPPAHIVTQQRRSGGNRESMNTARFQARLEALEKQNALLSAALSAVLRTNGTLNAPLSGLSEEDPASRTMSWENRIARRSAASHAASSSQGSSTALEMYMNTRRGGKHGR
ncbi:uncharacterized protein LTR77_000471 [Saxophila tyrrhenica]|uniref:Uncharacterized protein n=1 Tax=Saxophila tyrrhenica TaxID=1690608 RepID=A0AAV9PSJ1_9PEZI|nr:hypothetical protein LTR77_000471 [Saxophila tyrrhenica]